MKRDDTMIEAVWCVDSETGTEYLINIYTNEKLAVRKDGRLVYVQC